MICFPEKGEKNAADQIEAIWQGVITIWKMRCSTVDAPTAQNIEDQVNINRITIKTLYVERPALDQIGEQILNQPIVTIMGLPLN
jgi:hypothetical protein